MTTIFALSSGRLPSAVAVVRLSGDAAFAALMALTGRPLPPYRRMSLRALRHRGDLLDRALVVCFPAEASITGEDMVELHLHGSVAVVAAVFEALVALGLHAAAPGEFTRRAFDHGKLDLAQVEALGDLITAETGAQRQAALAQTAGILAQAVDEWRATLIGVRADLESTLDFADADDVPATLSPAAIAELDNLASSLAAATADSRRGALIRDGVTVAIVGPVNAGKSTLLNALARRDVAMVSSQPGTTRDIVEARIALGGQLVVVLDTAGRRSTDDPVEQEGIRRGAERAAAADLVIDLGPQPASGSIAVAAQSDRRGGAVGWRDGVLHLSAMTGDGLGELEAHLADRVAALVRPGVAPIAAWPRHTAAIAEAHALVDAALVEIDPVLAAEHLRGATAKLGALIGGVSHEDVLAAIFGRFCIGK